MGLANGAAHHHGSTVHHTHRTRSACKKQVEQEKNNYRSKNDENDGHEIQSFTSNLIYRSYSLLNRFLTREITIGMATIKLSNPTQNVPPMRATSG